MSGDRRKWDGDKPSIPNSDEDKRRGQQKEPDKGRSPDFDGIPEDADQVKHDGP